MKKIPKLATATISTIALILCSVSTQQRTAKALSLDTFCIGGTTTLSTRWEESDVITLESDDAGMTYEKIKTEHSGWYTDYFMVYFSTPGKHTLTSYTNGKLPIKHDVTVYESHSWDDGYVSKQATYLENGERTYTCKNCNDQKKEVIPKLVKDTEKTCIGDTEISVNCDETDTISFTSDDTGMTYKKTGSSSITVGAWKSYSASYSIVFSTAGNHTLTVYVNGKASDLMNFQVFASHDWEEKVTINPTCESTGEKELTCKNCGKKKTEELPKIDHDYQLKSTKEATCTERGEKKYTCSMCNKSKTEYADALGHDFQYDSTKEADCHHEGYKRDKCTRCGEVQDETIPKTEHNFGDWTVSKQATIFNAGEEVQKCSICGDENKKTIAKLPSSVTLAKKTLKLKKGKKTTLKISKKADCDSVKIFTSSKKSVATVTKAGKITAKKKGTTTITLTMKSGCKATCKVTVK